MWSLSLRDPFYSLSWFVLKIVSLREMQLRLQAFPTSVRDEGTELRLSMETNPSWPQQMKSYKYKENKFFLGSLFKRGRIQFFKTSVSPGKLL